MIGQTLGHYRIEAKLGEGGMGVVYKAHDTHLQRPVALKVLPAERVADPARKQRFIQEARAASALNHPNIVTIHDIAADAGVDFMVMEYIQGKTLDQLAGRHGLRLNETLKYAIQAADALAAAHRAGIVHRDLKPGNVMVTDSGLVKVLDFGLAKLTERPEPDEDGATQSFRQDTPRTEEGTIVGTVAYMSPEQAESRKIDSRSDIFSFGAVLYELVTGQRAFQGASRLSTLSAILKEEPKPVGSITPGVPPDIEKIITRCLRKDPDRRFQTMADLKVALEEVKDDLDSGRLSSASAAAAQAVGRPASKKGLVAAIAAVVLVAVLGGAAWWLTRPRQPAVPVLTKLTADLGMTGGPVVSPDGKLMVYSSDRSGEGHLDIWLKQVPQGEPARLTNEPGDEIGAVFSPDGTQIAFGADREGGGVYVMPTLGGVPRLVARNALFPRFSQDGKQILFLRFDPAVRTLSSMHIIPAAGGEAKPFQPDYRAVAALWTPDGSHVLFWGIRIPPKPGDSLRIHVAGLDGSEPVASNSSEYFKRHDLAPGLPGFSFAPSRRGTPQILIPLIRAGRGNIWRIAISPKTWQLEGEPEQVTQGTDWDILPSASADGRMFFTVGTRTDNLWLVPVDANQGKKQGENRRLSQQARFEGYPAASRDGARIAFFSTPYSQDTQPYGISVWDARNGSETLVVPGQTAIGYVVLNADGSRLAYTTRKGGPLSIETVSTTGGAPERLCQDCGNVRDWSADGKWLLTQTGDTQSQFFVVNAANGEKKELLREPDHGVFSGQFSPDSQWIAFLSRNRQNVHRLLIARFQNGVAAPRSEWIQVTEGKASDDKPRWSPDGNLLYFTSDRDASQGIWAQRLDPRTKKPLGPPFQVHQLRRGRFFETQRPTELAVAPDRLIFTFVEMRGNIWMLQLPD